MPQNMERIGNNVEDERTEEQKRNDERRTGAKILAGMALTLLEAMSYGACCLVSDIRENTEVVEDKALTFRKGDVKDLRRQLAWMLTHPDEVRCMGEESVDYICGKYDWDDVTRRTIAVYEKAAGCRKE